MKSLSEDDSAPLELPWDLPLVPPVFEFMLELLFEFWSVCVEAIPADNMLTPTKIQRATLTTNAIFIILLLIITARPFLRV
jgi:hypothetical protein